MTTPPPFEALGPELARALEGRGFTALTPVQEAVLAPEVEGRDLRISSQTGSGKTVAIGFALRSAVESHVGPPRGLVVTPTRELAKQVEQELAWLFEPFGAKIVSVTGGSSYRDEMRGLHGRPVVVVGTPGRLLDHLRRGTLEASELCTVVLDEADRMLDMGFREDIEEIFGFVPEDHRTHLVSATFPRDVLSLADRVQNDPVSVEGTPLGTANEDIEHVIHLVAPNERLDAMINLLLATPGAQTLVFAKTRADVSDLTEALREAGFVVGMLSGEMDQPERNRALASFKRGHLDALVATDVAARGIDVQDIGRVIHAEPPGDVDAYTHRSGRTGRAGKKGTSSVLVTPQIFTKTKRLLERAKVRFRVEPIPSPAEIRELRDQRVLDRLTREPEVDDVEGEPDAHLISLAERIAASADVVRAIGRLLVRARAAGAAEPRELTPLTITERRAPTRDRSPAPEPRADRSGPRDWEAFRVSWGQAHGADARRLLAMLCRRGGISSADVGAIRVARNYSVV